MLSLCPFLRIRVTVSYPIPRAKTHINVAEQRFGVLDVLDAVPAEHDVEAIRRVPEHHGVRDLVLHPVVLVPLVALKGVLDHVGGQVAAQHLETELLQIEGTQINDQ